MLPLVFLGACARRGLPQFPVGLYGVDSPRAVKEARAAGFTAFQSYKTDSATLSALARAARREGMEMLVSPSELISSGVSTRDWPIAAWYLNDEPDVSGLAPAALSAWERRVRAWSPETPTTFVVGQGAAAAPYAEVGDALMVDWYPVPHLPLESAGEQVRLLSGIAGSRPVWGVLQAMDWRNFPQHDPKKPRIGRFPSRAEMRFMSYHAVLEGARGLWYFTYTLPSGRTLADHPAEWLAVADVGREMAAMAPIFARGQPARLPFSSSVGGPLARCWTRFGRDYLVLANPRSNVTLRVPDAALTGQWRPLFEARRDQRELLQEQNGSYFLRPYQVLVLER